MQEHGTSGRRRRAQGSARQRQRDIRPAGPAYVTRQIPFLSFADEEALVRLEEQADWLMQEIGIEFRDDDEALRIWREAGADVEGTRVKAPRGMIRALCKTAPAEFTQLSRNPERSVRIGGNNQVFAPIYGAPFVRDLDGGRRY